MPKKREYRCDHGRHKSMCPECKPHLFCEHKRQRSSCRDCKGACVCEHGRPNHRCRDCGGTGICAHGRVTGRCRDCGGSQICEHNRVRSVCRDCGGNSICEHGRISTRCRDCSGSEFCEHRKRKSVCGLCDGTLIYKNHLRNLQRATRTLRTELTETRYRWLVAQPCTYCGLPSGGVDRAKNTHDYTIFNSVPCCWGCNKMKNTHDAPEFLEHIHRIVAHNSTYEEFKTRWVSTRTSGPDLNNLNSGLNATTAGTTVCTESGGN